MGWCGVGVAVAVGVALGVTLGVGVGVTGGAVGVGDGEAHGGISYVCDAAAGGLESQKSCVKNPAAESPWTPET